MPAAAFLTLALCLLAACAPTRPAPAGHVDADLRAQFDEAGPDTAVDVLVELTPDAPADARARLEGMGLEVRSVAGRVVVARGSRGAVERAAALPWVASVSRSYERPPLTAP